MARSSTFDPLDRFSWRLYVANPAGNVFIRAGFTECSSPGVTVEYKAYPEGGSHMNPRLIHEGATYKPITLRRGVIAKKNTDDFAQWMNEAFKVFKGLGGPRQYRVDLILEHLDRASNVAKRYTLHNCVPSYYEPASDFSAADDTAFSVETLTFQYEGFVEETVGESTGITDRIRGLF